jgi:muconate cycloisomerase
MRRLAGDETEIRLEVNGKLNRDQITREIDRLRPFHPAAIEQPLPAGDIEGLRQLRQSTGLAVIVDESLVSLEDAQQLLAAKACDIFNIKISKCGGLLRSRAIARLAAEAGINCQVGTHVGESELLGAAGRQLARGIPNFDCYGGGSQVLFSKFLETPNSALASEPPGFVYGASNPRMAVALRAPSLDKTTLCLDLAPAV